MKERKAKERSIVTDYLEKITGGSGASATKLLKKDLRKSAALMSRKQGRFLVDLYYQMQKYRITFAAQLRELEAAGEPTEITQFFYANAENLEKLIKDALGAFASEYAVGQWMQAIPGIGPVISAGFLSTLDVREKTTVGHWYSFAGLAPGIKWEKGKKRPWNADLKVLCWKASECFVKVQNKETDVYGYIYAKRKAYEVSKNEAHEYAAQAAVLVAKVGKTTEAHKFYSKGMLPPGHIHSRCERYCVKMFLSHLHHISYEDFYGEAPPKPFAFVKATGKHTHYYPPPRFEITGRPLKDLYAKDSGEEG